MILRAYEELKSLPSVEEAEQQKEHSNSKDKKTAEKPDDFQPVTGPVE